MIDKLEYLVALAAERHFGRAAEKLGVTQPTLSAGIRQLEERLGVLLVNRGARFQSITPEGERVLEWARRILGDVRTLTEEIRNARLGTAGHLRLAIVPTALAMLPKLTVPFLRRHPGATFDIVSATSSAILTRVRNFESDLGVTYLSADLAAGFDVRPLYEERYGLVTTAGSPFADRASVTWEEVASLPLCLLSGAMQNRRIVDGHLAAAGFAGRVALEANSMIALLAHVRTGPFVTILPHGAAEMLGLGAPTVAIPILPSGECHTIGLVAARRDPKPTLVTAFFESAAPPAG